MTTNCNRCKNIQKYYNTNKGRGGNRINPSQKVKILKPKHIYLLMHNNKIIRFSTSKKEGIKYLRELARVKTISYTSEFRTRIEEIDNIITITGMQKFLLISYEKVLDYFEIMKINSIPQNNYDQNIDIIKPPPLPPPPRSKIRKVRKINLNNIKGKKKLEKFISLVKQKINNKKLHNLVIKELNKKQKE